MTYVHLNIQATLRDRLKVIAAKEKVPMVDMVERWVVEYEAKELMIPPTKSAAELLRIAAEKQRKAQQ